MTPSVVGAVAERASLAGTMSMEEIRREIAGFRPELSEATLTYRAAVLLLLGPQLRFNIDRMASRTRYPRAQVAACARRLFDHGVWRPEGPDYTWTSCRDAEFWLDVAVAEGRLWRRTNKAGEIEWAEAGTWTKVYDFVTKDTSLTIAYVDVPAVVAPVPEEEEEEAPAEWSRKPAATRPVEMRVERAPVLPAAGPREEEFAMAGSTNSALGPTWTRLDGPRRSDLFPDAQWLS